MNEEILAEIFMTKKKETHREKLKRNFQWNVNLLM